MEKLRPITTSVYTFEDLIEGGFLYVDKTEWIWRLVEPAKAMYFCSRPRRFGKSLTVSTLEAVFRGRRDLFEGLSIAEEDYAWPVHPVVHLDFARSGAEDLAQLKRWLCRELFKCAEEYGAALPDDDEPGLLFSALIESLHAATGKGVVLLVDEYDKPVTDSLDSPELERIRRMMEGFYQVVKGDEPHLRLVFMTGVTKLAKVSVFSKLNNLQDISLDPRFACMMGYTQDELEGSFAAHLDEAAAQGVRSPDDGSALDRAGLLSELARRYDGFRFDEGAERVYNPVSVGSFFLQGYRFRNFWFETGTPTLVVRMARQVRLGALDLEDAEMSLDDLGSFDIADMAGGSYTAERVFQLLFQSGYLTMGGELGGWRWRSVRLVYPNLEVAESFERALVGAYADSDSTWSTPYLRALGKAAFSGDSGAMVEALRSMLAALPYDIQLPYEKYYQSMVYWTLKLAGADVRAEERTNAGRVDAVLEAGGHLYVIEFKMSGDAQVALDQIDQRRYAERYIVPAQEAGRAVHLVGIAFSWAAGQRNIVDWEERVV